MNILKRITVGEVVDHQEKIIKQINDDITMAKTEEQKCLFKKMLEQQTNKLNDIYEVSRDYCLWKGYDHY